MPMKLCILFMAVYDYISGFTLVVITDLLRDVPPTPESHYVFRHEFINEICHHLRDIDKNNGHVLIHGMAGSGKTVATCQSVRFLFENEDCFRPYGVYWLKIGMIRK